MSEAHNKLARILRTKPDVLLDLEEKMNKLTGKSGIIERVAEENRILIGRTLEELGLSAGVCNAKDVYNILIKRIEHMDEHLYNFLGKPELSKMSSVCGQLCDTALTLNKPAKGFFIKKEKAVQMLEKFPPQNLLDHFEYKTVAELVGKEGFESVFSSLRFAQDQKWMHEFFNKAYDDLTADDFEERDVVLKVLESQWLDVAEKFLEKKYHNVSHLKEFGVIFVIPLKIDTPGETLRLFTLILHYLNEVPFYSRLFKKFSGEPDFMSKLKSLLRGDVPEGQPGTWNLKPETLSIRIVQRYLAKDDPNDFRLMEPHINPEAEHWYKAEGDLGKIATLLGKEGRPPHHFGQSQSGGGQAFGFWQGLDFVGDFFPNTTETQNELETRKDREETLISFDLIDLVMSLVKKDEIKYLYHQQEAFWNKIFIEYLGRDKIEKLVEENIIEGFIRL